MTTRSLLPHRIVFLMLGAMQMAMATAASPPLATPPALAPDSAMMAAVTTAAKVARQRCLEFMHENADEYLSCMNALHLEVKGKAAADDWKRLGIAYFAWVGANTAARVSVPGSEAAAVHFLQRFRALQHRLKIGDEVLCSSVEGDCTTRLAQIAAVERDVKLREKAARAASAATGAGAKRK